MPTPVPDAAFLRERQENGFYSLLYLAQAIGEVAPTAEVRINVVTDGVHEVSGCEPLVPEKATVLGPCRVIPQEFPKAWCRNIDLPIDAADPSGSDIEQLAAELFAPASEAVVAYRLGRRWVQTFESMRLPPVGDGAPLRLRVGGTYLITGGTGGIGLVLARYLAEALKARLVLTSRRGLPARERWADYAGRASDDTADRIRIVQELEAAGAEVIVGAADVTDEVAMSQIVDEACARFGRIDGVVHAAGVAGGGMIQLKKPEVAAGVLAPKMVGARVLAQIFEDRPPDFMLLCSSLTGVLGGVGQVDYCAANAYLDSFARQHSATTKTFTVAVNWNAWREVGMAVDTNVPDDLKETFKGGMLATGITNAQGVDAFCRVLNQHSERQIALSAHDVELLLDEDRAKLTERKETLTIGTDQSSESADARHPRPNLQNAFVAPRNEAETIICALWQESLGMERIGIDDNFFELGGHSLLAVTVMTRVNAALQADIPVAKLYEGLTVRFLAGLVASPEEGDAAPAADDDLAERRKDKARRQKEHQMRRRVVMRR